jgi:hypothetical protein
VREYQSAECTSCDLPILGEGMKSDVVREDGPIESRGVDQEPFVAESFNSVFLSSSHVNLPNP